MHRSFVTQIEILSFEYRFSEQLNKNYVLLNWKDNAVKKFWAVFENIKSFQTLDMFGPKIHGPGASVPTTGRRSKTFCSIVTELTCLSFIGVTFSNPTNLSASTFIISWWTSLNFLSSNIIGSDNETWIQTSVRRAWPVLDNRQSGLNGLYHALNLH